MNARLAMGCLLWAACIAELTAAEMTSRRDLSYFDSKQSSRSTTLDVYFAPGEKDLPTMIFIHGGGWQRGDKAHTTLKPKAFVEQGFVFVSANYRLVPAVDYQDQAGDVARAIRYVYDHAKEWGGSSKSIYLMGHSAGAHLAALVAVDEKYLKKEGLTPDMLDGVVLLDGAGYDIPRHVRTAGPVARGLYERAFGVDPKVQADASPLRHVAAGKGIAPFLIIHVASRRDSKVQSNALADALQKVGGAVKVVSAEGKTHLSLNQELGRTGDVPTQAVFDFLKNCAGSKTGN